MLQRRHDYLMTMGEYKCKLKLQWNVDDQEKYKEVLFLITSDIYNLLHMRDKVHFWGFFSIKKYSHKPLTSHLPLVIF